MTQSKQLDLKKRIERRAGLSEALLERMGITREAFERVGLNALVLVPGLADCTPDSLDAAFITTINAGLLPDGRQAVIVPFGDQATLIPMIEGKIKLAKRATPGLALRVRVVYEDDEWEYREGLVPTLNHTPSPTADRRDANLIAAYAVSVTPGASVPEFEVIFRSELDRIRARSRAKKSPWDTYFPEMCKKSVLSPLLKRLLKDSSAPPDAPAGLESHELEGFDGIVDAERAQWGTDSAATGQLKRDLEVTANDPIPNPIPSTTTSIVDAEVVNGQVTGVVVANPGQGYHEMAEAPATPDESNESPF